MDVYKIAVKIFASAPQGVEFDFVPIFHHWIQKQSVQGHRLIDVADYGHVAAGPGTVLVSSEANFYMDRGENRLGLLYSRKLPLEGSFQDRLRAAIGEAVKAAATLEQEPEVAGKLKFNTDEIVIRLNDRLRAPPNDQTVAAAKGDVQAVANWLYGDSAVVESHFTPLTAVEFRIRSKEKPALETLLKKV
ncbi:MAG: hypothetical protein ABSD28_16820 [Tepidisphaeraceae bacterium]|jgi:hypothetical protein